MIVVSWMVEVAEEFGLQQETLHAAVALLDRFLATSNVSCVSAGGNRGVGGCGGKVCVLCCVCACVCVCVCVRVCACVNVSASTGMCGWGVFATTQSAACGSMCTPRTDSLGHEGHGA
jgi:hypothetical protein